jgi:hypothetical protein
MTGSRPIAAMTFGSLAIAGLIGVVWFFSVSGTSRFEPAISSLGLLAGLTGILAERRATARERRYLTLITLADELNKNQSSLNNLDYALRHELAPKPRVYPRLAVSAVDAALVSGALTKAGDTPLLRSLHEWRDEVNSFNRRLDLTEMRIFATGRREEVIEFEQVLHRDHGYLDHLRASLADVITLLPQHHYRASEMTTDIPASVPESVAVGHKP